jgi:hypothetical protein
MSSQTDLLPSRFPVGTRYVVEGRGGPQGRLRIQSRRMELPVGRPQPARSRHRRPLRRTVRK